MPALEAWNLNAGPPWKWINIDFAFKKNPMVNQEDCAAIGEVNGNPLQYSFSLLFELKDNCFTALCWFPPVDRGAWRTAVHGVAKNRTHARALAHTHTHTQ